MSKESLMFEEDISQEETPAEADSVDERITKAEKEEIKYLEKLQTNGKIGEDEWIPAHWNRLQELREKKNTGPSEKEIERFNELSRLQTQGGKNWTPELAEEIKKLYPLMEKRRGNN